MTKIEYTICDNCQKKIENAEACGHGAEYTLHDAWCKGCGGEHWDFCSLNCLKEFVNKIKSPSVFKEDIK